MVTQSEEGRPDIISKRAYDTEELWWVICQYNGVVNPILDIIPGMVVLIPNYSALTQVLSESKNKTNSRIGTRTTI